MSTFNNTITGPQNENAIEGVSINGRGVVGSSDTNYGMRAHSKKSAGIRASSDEGRGVEGWATRAEGVVGISTAGNGVWGQTEGGGAGVVGTSRSGIGVFGESRQNEGVRGVSHSGHAGVVGLNQSNDPRFTTIPGRNAGEVTAGGAGGWFESSHGEGVHGWSKSARHGGVVGVNSAGGAGVVGTSENGAGVFAASTNHEAVHAETRSTATAAVAALQLNRASERPALYARHAGNRTAALFEGHVTVTGNLVVTGNIDVTGPGSDIRLTNADVAEDFDVCGESEAEPGTVMVLGGDGALSESREAYDSRVAGVISGGGDYKPAIVLDSRRTTANRQPIALMGKVFCKVDAQYGAIQVGDLLTTSPTPGHAMGVGDPARALGTVIGKALRPLASGTGLIPILVGLR